MKTIQILKLSIYILFSLLLFGLLGEVTLTTITFVFGKNTIPLGYSFEDVPITLKILALIKLISVVLFCIGIFQIIKMLKLKKINDYLSNKSFNSLNISGKYLVISGILKVVLSFSFFVVDNKYKLYIGYDMNSSLLIVIIGLFIVTGSINLP